MNDVPYIKSPPLAPEGATGETPTPRKGKGGWPKGVPRPKKPKISREEVKAAADRAELRPKNKMLGKMRAAPNWESEDYIGVGSDHVDRLKIPAELVMALHRDGVALQWVTHQVRGRPEPQELSKMTRGGWTPVHQSDFDGLLDGLFMPKGRDDVITVDDCMLVARPTEIHTKAKMMERRQAAGPVQVINEQLGRGIPNVTGSNHPTATRGNMTTTKSYFERVESPE